MENYLYFCDTTDEPNATNEAILLPASKVLGIVPGVVAGTTGDNMTLFFEALSNTGAAQGTVLLTIANGKYAEACDDLIAAMNSTPSDGFVVIANAFLPAAGNSEGLPAGIGQFCSEHITGLTIDTEV